MAGALWERGFLTDGSQHVSLRHNINLSGYCVGWKPESGRYHSF